MMLKGLLVGAALYAVIIPPPPIPPNVVAPPPCSQAEEGNERCHRDMIGVMKVVRCVFAELQLLVFCAGRLTVYSKSAAEKPAAGITSGI